jgi:hypothetical protein
MNIKLFRSIRSISIILFMIGLAACTGTVTPKPSSTSAPAPTSTSISPTAATAPTAAPTAAPIVLPTSDASGGTEALYLDDRSDAVAVIRSLFNAIDRREYVRAYSYWEDTPQRLGFDQFQSGYQNTTAVQVTIGTVGGDSGAGQFHSTVPVMLVSNMIGGAEQTYVGCYLLHISQPAIQGTLPFQALGIQAADIQPVTGSPNTNDLLMHACDQLAPGAPPLPPTPTYALDDVNSSRYLDDRSDAAELLRSFFNALNRHEYVRAYSDWGNTASLPGLDQFQVGYSNTQSIDLTIGSVTSEGTAGSIYYRVPAGLIAHTTDGGTQTYIGCYILRQPEPGIQTEPPFTPIGIDSANVQLASNAVDVTALLNQACSGQ